MEDGSIFGLSNALYGEITTKNGAVVQDDFPSWRVMRMEEAPRSFEVGIIPSNSPPARVGDPPDLGSCVAAMIMSAPRRLLHQSALGCYFTQP